MAKVFLGVGHGGNDPGAVGYLKEEDVNLNMALACRDFLIANGVEVKMSRTRDENDDLNEEIRECNEYNPDLAVDIHNNSGKGDGFEVYHSIFKGKGTILAQNIEKEVLAIGQNSRGCKSKKSTKGNYDYYGFIRSTKAPAVICEGVFVDNANDVKIADTLEEQKAFGVAYAKGILKTLGIEIVLHTLQCNAHIEDIGWTGYKDTSKEIVGTEGQGKRLEAIQFKSNNGLEIQYRVHIQDIGWQDWKKNEEVAGTTGQSKRIEAIEIKSNKMLEVQEHVENIGWMPKSKGTEIHIGTIGKSLRLEAFKINVI